MRQLGRRQTRDSLLAFYINQLTNLDPKLHQPLVSVSWGRDIDLRPGISLSNESTSFIRSNFAAPGTLSNPNTASNGGNMSWISPETTAIPGIQVNGSLTTLPLRPMAREVSYTSIELKRSQLLGTPIDTQQINALQTVYQMNTDQMVYIGDAAVSATGLLNDANVTSGNVAAGASGSTLWSQKTPDEILADVNTLLTNTWSSGALAVCPGKLLLPPTSFSYIASQKVSSAGNVSILKFLKENSIALQINGQELDIQPVKWLTGRGSGGTNRMVAYTKSLDYVRYPMVPIMRETAYYQGLRFAAPYLWLLGQVEIVYPETIQYADGI
jgi:hypothetical protein